MKKKFFMRTLALYLLPLLVPMLLFGSISGIMSQRFLKDNIEKNNLSLLSQCRENIDLILQDVDALSLNFDKDPKITKRLKEILSSNSLTLENLEALDYIKNYIHVPAFSKPHILSIYAYFENDGVNFISSTDGLSHLDSFYDSGWYDSYIKNKAEKDFWYEHRDIKRFSFDKEAVPVVTIYKKLRSPGIELGDGVIVLNLRRSHIENLLQRLTTYDNQAVLVVGGQGNIIFMNKDIPNLDKINLTEIINEKRSFFTINAGATVYTISMIHSERYQWSYISIIPQGSLYQLLTNLTILFILLFLFSIFLGFALSFYIARKNYQRILNIINIIECAETNQPLPPMPDIIKDEYGFIIQNILKTFIEQKYLNVQLSERKYKMTAMELMALQSQINPHFLYNTLHTIYWEVFNLTKGPNMANSMLEYLTDILEYSLSNPNEQVTLENELKNSRSYISIQKIRYKDKFDVDWEYDEKILTCKTVKLILQPIIENAIYHGIKGKSGRSRIKIKMRTIEGKLKISIIDNGLGIDKNKLAEIKKRLMGDEEYSDHIGLYNTNKRLQLSYGDKCSLKILSRQGRGTVVYVNIPVEQQHY